MKKQILNLGTALSKAEQKQIIGGDLCQVTPQLCRFGACNSILDCIDNTIEYSVEELNGFGCQEGQCGYA